MKYVCSICGYVYDEAENTPWAELSDQWKCPLCGAAKADFVPEYPKEEKFFLPPPEKILTIREAAFREYEEITVDKAVGRICASLDLPCPPAVPIAVSGELITAELAEIMKSFGISTVRVVKNDTKE